MRRAFPLLLILALLVLPGFATAQALYTQVAMLPPSPGPHPDLEALLQQYWKDYWNGPGELGFTADDIRVGRADLDDDDYAELCLMIDRPSWLSSEGKPFVIANWIDHKWVAIGWGWADEDGIWVTTEKQGGWRSVDAGNYLMRWAGTAYDRVRKTP